MLGFTQDDLAKCVGVAFQQIQKYEFGINRISTARLWQLSKALSCPVSFFYAGLGRNSDQIESTVDPEMHQDSLKLLRAYRMIRPEETRRQILNLAAVLSRGDGGGGTDSLIAPVGHPEGIPIPSVSFQP